MSPCHSNAAWTSPNASSHQWRGGGRRGGGGPPPPAAWPPGGVWRMGVDRACLLAGEGRRFIAAGPGGGSRSSPGSLEEHQDVGGRRADARLQAAHGLPPLAAEVVDLT